MLVGFGSDTLSSLFPLPSMLVIFRPLPPLLPPLVHFCLILGPLTFHNAKNNACAFFSSPMFLCFFLFFFTGALLFFFFFVTGPQDGGPRGGGPRGRSPGSRGPEGWGAEVYDTSMNTAVSVWIDQMTICSMSVDSPVIPRPLHNSAAGRLTTLPIELINNQRDMSVAGLQECKNTLP